MNDVRREKYQVMPALPAEDYERLLAEPLEDARIRLRLGMPAAYLAMQQPEA